MMDPDQSKGEVCPSSLSITVIRAADLQPKTFSGGTNPYAVLQLGETTLSTPVLHHTLTPRWNSVFTFPLPAQQPRGAAAAAVGETDTDEPPVFSLTVIHQRSLVALRAHKFLGMVNLQLDDIIRKYNGKKMCFELQSKPGKKHKSRGFVELSFSLAGEAPPASAQTRGDLASSAVRPQTATATSPLLWPRARTEAAAAQIQADAHTATSGRAQPNSHRRRRPQPTSNHIIWEDAGLCPPASVQPGVGEREPIQPSCVENFGLGTSSPSAAPGRQPPAAKPGRRRPAADSTPPRPVSTESACEHGATVGDQAEVYLLGRDHISSSRSAGAENPAGNPVDPQNSSSVPPFLFRHRSSGVASLGSVLGRLRRRWSAGMERGGEAVRAPAGAMFSSEGLTFYLPVDRYPETADGEHPSGIIARLFPCLGGD